MAADPVRYRSPEEDSGRWQRFAFREGDIVISTRSKSGTTWMQMICALLIFQTADLPAPLAELSPWVDWLVLPEAELFTRLAAQRHRRFVKTHTPLDGIPLDPRATYIVVARHPLDMAVSLYHQSGNIDRQRLGQLTGQPAPGSPSPPRRPLREWLLRWIDGDSDPRDQPDSLPGVMWHLADAWARRREPNIVLVHYEALEAASAARCAAWHSGWASPFGIINGLACCGRLRSSRCAPTPTGWSRPRPGCCGTGQRFSGGAVPVPGASCSPPPNWRTTTPAPRS